ncbi:MAG: response regulator transcription factor [Pseudanabaena sp. ELA607]|jgi:two-component system NarL family response regulator
MSKYPIRILLIEDDELFRLGLRMRLQQESHLEITAEAEDGETAIELVSQYPIDIVMLDVGLPGIGGIEACKQIKQRQPQLPILVLTSHSQPVLINRLIETGAQGYCLKGIDAETLILAVRSVVAGASWWDNTATQAIRTAFEPATIANESAASPKIVHNLTQREQEILTLIAKGKSNLEIAQILYITTGTVRVHVHSILHKLEVRDRTQAVIMAVKNQLI